MSMSDYGATGKASGLSGTGYKQVSVPTVSPQQMQLFQQLLGGSARGTQAGLGNLSQMAEGGSPEYWNQLEAPALRQFGELQGQLASRFGSGGGMPGSLTSRRSSGFYNESSGAGADLAERLQGQRLELQQRAIKQLLGLSGDLLGTNLEDSFLVPKQKKPSWWQQLLGGGLPVAGAIGGGLLGGPAGSSLGARLGSGLGSAFL